LSEQTTDNNNSEKLWWLCRELKQDVMVSATQPHLFFVSQIDKLGKINVHIKPTGNQLMP